MRVQTSSTIYGACAILEHRKLLPLTPRGICLMHMHQTPQNMHLSPLPGDPVPIVLEFLQAASQDIMQRGIARERIVWDYGIGFGKTVQQNFTLLARQQQLLGQGFALLAGWSRKSALGQVSGRAVHERMVPSVAAALLAIEHGARIVRVHDVAETVAALSVWQAMRDGVSHCWEPTPL